jgi:hypothetical protein
MYIARRRMKMKTLIAIFTLTGASLLWMAAQTTSDSDMKATAAFVPDQPQKPVARGNLTLEHGVGGFGTFTYVGNGFTVVRPLYPKGHQLNSAELDELNNYYWPVNMTAVDFDDMVRQYRALAGE